MLIGYKYCGGCNPFYDRTQLLHELKSQFSGLAEFESIKPGVIYDVVILISGCERHCISTNQYMEKYGKIDITNKDQIASVSNFISKYLECRGKEK